VRIKKNDGVSHPGEEYRYRQACDQEEEEETSQDLKLKQLELRLFRKRI
jgi:hypothetical protein